MEFTEVVKLILSESATLALAVVALWMLDKVWKARVKDAQGYADSLRTLNEEVRQTIDRNTEAWATLLARVEK